MIEQIKHIEDLSVIHWFLAYGTLFGKLCLNFAMSEGSLLEVLNRKVIFTAVGHAVFIPIALITCTDTAMKTMLPINNLTAVLVGLNIEMFLNMVIKLGELKSKKSKDENS